MVQSQDAIAVADTVDIPYAYVIYDEERKKSLPTIVNYLRQHDVFSIGRYGSWAYMSMEDTLLQGKEVAEAIHG